METIKVSIDEPIMQSASVSSELYDQVELLSLKGALNPAMERFIEVPMNTYNEIKGKMSVRPIKIKVSDYYGKPSYYSIMPQSIFDALEAANLNSEEFALVDKIQFDQMVVDHKSKMEQWEKSNL